jgi:hypothetical protein
VCADRCALRRLPETNRSFKQNKKYSTKKNQFSSVNLTDFIRKTSVNLLMVALTSHFC